MNAIETKLAPVQAAVSELQTKRLALRATQDKVTAAEAEHERAVVALDEAEVASAMNPSAATTRGLETARGKVADAKEALDLLKARIRGFSRVIEADQQKLADLAPVAKGVRHDLVKTLSAEYTELLRIEAERFQKVVGLGLAVASTCDLEVLQIQLRNISCGAAGRRCPYR